MTAANTIRGSGRVTEPVSHGHTPLGVSSQPAAGVASTPVAPALLSDEAPRVPQIRALWQTLWERRGEILNTMELRRLVGIGGKNPEGHLRVLLHKLREHLPARYRIESVRGQGYRLMGGPPQELAADRVCAYSGCGKPIVRRPGEKIFNFNRRRCCDLKCAAKARHETAPESYRNDRRERLEPDWKPGIFAADWALMDKLTTEKPFHDVSPLALRREERMPEWRQTLMRRPRNLAALGDPQYARGV